MPSRKGFANWPWDWNIPLNVIVGLYQIKDHSHYNAYALQNSDHNDFAGCMIQRDVVTIGLLKRRNDVIKHPLAEQAAHEGLRAFTSSYPPLYVVGKGLACSS